MPKKKRKSGKSSNKLIPIVIIVIAVVVVGVVAWHDGLVAGTTIASLEQINDGEIATGTKVTVKGKVTIIFGNLMTISDDNGHGVVFAWGGDKPALDSVVVVRGEVSTPVTLGEIVSVEKVWIFGNIP